LGADAIVNGFISVSIKTFMDASFTDDLGWSNCDYVSDVTNARKPLDSTYEEVLWVKPQLEQAYATDMKVSKEAMKRLTFPEFTMVSDLIFAEVFEGVPQAEHWTKREWNELVATLKSGLVDPYTPFARSIDIAKQLRGPMADIHKVVSGSKDALKFKIYSAHDTNIANWLD